MHLCSYFQCIPFQMSECVENGSGKSHIQLLEHRHIGTIHDIKQVDITTRLELSSARGYLYGENTQTVSSDSQTNMCCILAKQYGVSNVCLKSQVKI
jgi:urate oxidase